jgi:hypothetical protein
VVFPAADHFARSEVESTPELREHQRRPRRRPALVVGGALRRLRRDRNGAPELSAMHITESDVAPLAAFLRALNEDYG